jgi:hypothetical protein
MNYCRARKLFELNRVFRGLYYNGRGIRIT